MKPPVERVKVSKRAKDILIKVKRNTGLQHWNEICRIALCRSLLNKNPPPVRNKMRDSNIEMDWKTFAGNYEQELVVLLKKRAMDDNLDCDDGYLAEYFKNHLERGIMFLNDVKCFKNIV